MTDFAEPSAKARGLKQKQSKYTFDWAGLPVDKSIPVALETIKLATLRSMASQKGKQLGRKFRVIDHGDDGYEIYRDFDDKPDAAPVLNKNPTPGVIPTYRGFQSPPDNPKPSDNPPALTPWAQFAKDQKLGE